MCTMRMVVLKSARPSGRATVRTSLALSLRESSTAYLSSVAPYFRAELLCDASTLWPLQSSGDLSSIPTEAHWIFHTNFEDWFGSETVMA